MNILTSIDPIAFEIFGFSVHWYGIAYAVAFIMGLLLVKRIFKSFPLAGITDKSIDSLFNWTIIGTILGGRLGYVLFYNPAFYFSHPIEILKTWEGGMSFHGGLLGVLICILIFCRNNQVNFVDLMDRIAPAFCIGLFFGRIANFINMELYGKVTTSSWGMIFPNAGDLPRHPSQLYEAFLEGILLFIILTTVLYLRKRPKRYEISGLFLLGYGSFRTIVEHFREADEHLQEGIFQIISMGQILSIPMILLGSILLLYAWRNCKCTY